MPCSKRRSGRWPRAVAWRSSISSLSGARIFISGGAGLIGSHIADQALALGAARVVILDDFVRGSRANLAAAIASERIDVIEGDICDRDSMMELLRDTDIVFHQAALRVTHCAEEPQRAVAVMATGTQNVLDASVQNGVGKVVAASSASVYGEASYLPMDEAHPFNNRTLYGALKIANEQMLRAYNEMYGLRYLALRPFNVYGPRMDVHGVYTEVMVRWLDRLAKGEAPIIFGDGSQTMDFVHVADVAAAYILAATSDLSDEVFNVGCEVETSLLELCKLLCEASGFDGDGPIFQPARTVNPVSRRLASLERARGRLGFEPRISLRDGLRDLIDWYATQTRTSAPAP